MIKIVLARTFTANKNGTSIWRRLKDHVKNDEKTNNRRTLSEGERFPRIMSIFPLFCEQMYHTIPLQPLNASVPFLIVYSACTTKYVTLFFFVTSDSVSLFLHNSLVKSSSFNQMLITLCGLRLSLSNLILLEIG